MQILNSVGLSIVAFLFVLGVMIFIHELGHYLVAKALGIGVETFSLGFGRRLLGFRRGETDYRLSLLPLGGYVKMAGENYDEELTGSPREFLSRPKRQRFMVALAGPVMNLLLAFSLVAGSLMIGMPVFKYRRQAARVAEVRPDSPAQKAGLRAGDIIVGIDGDPTPTWQDVEIVIASSPGQELMLEVKRENRFLEIPVATEAAGQNHAGSIGATPFIPYVVGSVEPGSPAEKAGLQPGDEIIRVSSGSRSATDFNSARKLIAASHGAPLSFEVRRGDRSFTLTLAAARRHGTWQVGTVADVVLLEQFGPLEAMRQSLGRCWRLTELTFSILGRIVTGRTSLRTLSGPIEIARFSGQAASLGVVQLLSFMAVVSLQLGIINLMPIPILDGGMIALLGVEGVLGRDLSLRVKERIFQAGFIFLILLMGIVIFNDIAKNLPTFN